MSIPTLVGLVAASVTVGWVMGTLCPEPPHGIDPEFWRTMWLAHRKTIKARVLAVPAARLAVAGLLGLALTLALLLGCSVATEQRPSHRTRPVYQSYNTVLAAEIARQHASSLYDALERARPLWFSGSRPVQSVFLEGQYLGGLGELRYLDASSVLSVKHLSEVETTSRHSVRYRGPSLELTMAMR